MAFLEQDYSKKSLYEGNGMESVCLIVQLSKVT
ncbi:hypothetical protein SAMN05421787_1171 [Virgibacillus pantothenticus]|nr:hypothetical protein SAMN05421787_1171 [Virgibacillus pantothenticus]